MSTDNGEQTDLNAWIEAADEGDQTLAWVKAETLNDGADESEKETEQTDRVRWLFDLVEKPRNWTSSRRAFLKLLGSSATIGGGIAFKGGAIPSVLQNFWPNALHQEESESVLDAATVETLLSDFKLGWEEFTDRSKEVLYNPDIVTSYDDVHLLSVFYRAIDKDFMNAIEKSARRADSVYVYFADPVNHQTKETSALELYEEIELRCFRHLFHNANWARFYNEVVENPANDKVPHPDDSTLNRVRALANALRAIEMGAFLTHNYRNVHVRLIDHHEISVRGRLIGDNRATFLMNPKGTIGTTPPRLGFVTNQDPIIDELHEERERISNKRTYDLADLVNLSEITSERGRTLLDTAVEDDVLSSRRASSVAEKLDELAIDEKREFDRGSDEWVHDHDKENRILVNEITDEINDVQPFTEPSERRRELLRPGRLYKTVERRVLRDNP